MAGPEEVNAKFADKLKDLRNQAQEAVGRNRAKIHDTVAVVSDTVDQGQWQHSQVGKFGDTWRGGHSLQGELPAGATRRRQIGTAPAGRYDCVHAVPSNGVTSRAYDSPPAGHQDG
jgi:hypothetical protein